MKDAWDDLQSYVQRAVESATWPTPIAVKLLALTFIVGIVTAVASDRMRERSQRRAPLARVVDFSYDLSVASFAISLTLVGEALLFEIKNPPQQSPLWIALMPLLSLACMAVVASSNDGQEGASADRTPYILAGFSIVTSLLVLFATASFYAMRHVP